MGRVPDANFQLLYYLQLLAKKLLKPKLIFWLRWLRTFACVVALLIVIPIRYLAHVFQESVLIITKIVVRGDIDQVCTGTQSTGCCMTQLLVAIIFSDFSRILAGGLSVCSCQGSRLIVSWFGFLFFMRLEGFFLFTGPLAFSTMSIHLLNPNKRLECSFGLGFDGFIKHFVQRVQLSIPTIYLGLDGWP